MRPLFRADNAGDLLTRALAPARPDPARSSALPGAPPRYFIDDKDHVEMAVGALLSGRVVTHAFANFYVITTRADAATVRGINVMKGRPPDQVGSRADHAPAPRSSVRLVAAAAPEFRRGNCTR